MLRKLLISMLATVPAYAAQAQTHGPLTLGTPFGDHMVLQRDVPVNVFGTARPLAAVRIEVAGQAADATADAAGRWRATLAPLGAGGPHAMTVTSGDQTVELADVLVGEVWVASGQSNMEWPVGRLLPGDARQLLTSAGDGQLRLLTVTKAAEPRPQASADSSGWQVDSDRSAETFSAVAYYFARRLREELKVPVGVIDTTWGGTPAEAWTPAGALARDPATAGLLAQAADTPEALAELAAAAKKGTAADPRPTYQPEPPNIGLDKGYARPGFDDAAWEEFALPGMIEQHFGRALDGIVWFRRTVSLPEAMRGKALRLELGAIDDADHTYINGEQVGHTGVNTPNHWQVRRAYDVPATMTGGEELTIAVRLFDHFGGGGFTGGRGDLRLVGPDGGDVPLAGAWRAHLEHELDPAAVAGPGDAGGANHAGFPAPQHRPGHLYNGMVAPLVPMTARGVIWYQGESNAGRPEQYRTLFPLMIAAWREAFEVPDMPFGFVQLAGFKAVADGPSDTEWARLRDAQRHALQAVENTGMAVAVDVGDADDIHPRNKKDVGHRLARWALHDVYGRADIAKSGPRFDTADFKGGRAIVRFFESRGMTSRDGGPVRGFTLAGDDGVFHEAAAVVDGHTVTVTSPDVPEPAAVRYAWADNPVEANLVNGEGLPAGPFRTDDWPRRGE